jgi:hypothetical protein
MRGSGAFKEIAAEGSAPHPVASPPCANVRDSRIDFSGEITCG